MLTVDGRHWQPTTACHVGPRDSVSIRQAKLVVEL